MLIEQLAKKKHHSRLSFICVMASCAVAAVAVAVILIPSIKNYFVFTKVDVFYYAGIFIVGGLCAAFPKICFPSFIVLYVILSVFTTFALYDSFGFLTGTVPVTVAQDSVTVGRERYQFAQEAGSQTTVLFTVYTLPDKLLVPLPRTWYKSAGVTSNIAPLPVEKNLPDSMQLSSPFAFFYRYVFSSAATKNAELPFSAVTPSLYTITVHRELCQITFSAARSF